MTLINEMTQLLLTSAGVAAVCTIVVLGVNDALRKIRLGFVEFEESFASLFGTLTHPLQKGVHGALGFLLVSWAVCAVFLFSLQAGWLPASPFLAAVILAFVLVVLVGLVVFPVLGKGFFGVRHHSRAPAGIILLVVAFTLTIAVLVTLLS